MFDYKQCSMCNERFYDDRSKFTRRIKAEYKIAIHMGNKHGKWMHLVNVILATIALPLVPVLWMLHKVLFPFWKLYEWLDQIDCM